MKYSVDVTKLISWFSNGEDQKSEFRCAVCGEVFNRDISEEYGNLTFSTEKRPIANNLENELEAGLIWTCSDRCRVTYTLQKA